MVPLTQQAQRFVSTALPSGGIAIDATAGNGHDTLFLANRVGPGGTVYAIDIQQSALDRTAARLLAAGLSNVELVLGDHAELGQLLPETIRGRVQAIMFNLGYLPGGNQQLVTRPERTLLALEGAQEFLAPGGILSVLAYRGHPGGAEETKAVRRWYGGHSAEDWRALAFPDEDDGIGPVLFVAQRS
jgi:16S rRNA C1402 N4-methylase RsmH